MDVDVTPNIKPKSFDVVADESNYMDEVRARGYVLTDFDVSQTIL